jgi:hypothetical protein
MIFSGDTGSRPVREVFLSDGDGESTVKGENPAQNSQLAELEG